MQQDYILRLIERLGVLFQAIRKLIIGRGDPERIEADLQAAASASGYDLDLIRELDLESLLAVVASGAEIDLSRCWLMAELLLLDGLQDVSAGNPDRAAARLVKSRALFELLGNAGTVIRAFPEAEFRIEEIDAELARMERG